jgi:hypothetical protein
MAVRKGQSGPLDLTRRELLRSGLSLAGLFGLSRKGRGEAEGNVEAPAVRQRPGRDR